MKNKIYLILFALTLITFSCYKREAIQISSTEKGFRNYNWNTTASKIINDLGEPTLTQNFQQYGTEVSYLYFGNTVEYGYNTMFWYTFIENKLVGGGYLIISPSKDNNKDINGTEDAYIDLQKQFSILYGEPTTTSDFLDSIWNKNKDIPQDVDDLSDEDFISLLPFQTFWNDGESIIKLSLNFDEYYLLKIDILGPTIVHLMDLELAEGIEQLLNEYK